MFYIDVKISTILQLKLTKIQLVNDSLCKKRFLSLYVKKVIVKHKIQHAHFHDVSSTPFVPVLFIIFT